MLVKIFVLRKYIQLQPICSALYTGKTITCYVFIKSPSNTFNNSSFSVWIHVGPVMATRKLMNLNDCKRSTLINSNKTNVEPVLDDELCLQTPLMSHKGKLRISSDFFNIHRQINLLFFLNRTYTAAFHLGKSLSQVRNLCCCFFINHVYSTTKNKIFLS